MERYQVTVTYLVSIEAESENEAAAKAIEEVEQGFWEYTDVEVEPVSEILKGVFKE